MSKKIITIVRDTDDFSWENDSGTDGNELRNDDFFAEEQEADELFGPELGKDLRGRNIRQENPPLELIYPDRVPEEVEEPDEPDEYEEYEEDPAPEGRRRISAKAWITAVLFVLALAALAYVVTDGFGGLFGGSKTRILWESNEPISFEGTDITLSSCIGEHNLLLAGSTEGLSAYSAERVMQWSIPFQMNDPQMLRNGDYFAVLDVGERQAVVGNSAGRAYQVQSQYTIVSGFLTARGQLVLMAQNGLSDEILVYGKDGSQVLRRVTHSSRNGKPVQAVLSEDGSVLATAYIVYNGSEMASFITFFDLSAAGGAYTDRISANFYYPDTIFGDLWISGGSCFAVGDNKILRYNISGVPELADTQSLSNQIYLEDHSDSLYAVIFGTDRMMAEDSMKDYLVVYNTSGQEILRRRLENPTYLQVSGERLIYGEGYQYTCLDAKGKEVWHESARQRTLYYGLRPGGRQVIKMSEDGYHLMDILTVEEEKNERGTD